MHARIGAPTSLYLQGTVKNLRECRLNVILHSRTPRLTLPTIKIRAIVGA